ncbi:Nucleobindin-1 [Sarcoptes scabiei]|nr:Nucleobindin-1 [Sarcoptes scabiei]
MDLNNETMIDKKEKIIIDDGIDRYTNDGQSLEFLQSDDHQCCAILDVILLDNLMQSSKSIGLIRSVSCNSCCLFVWSSSFNIEAIVPIDDHFKFRLVSLDSITKDLLVLESDLSLIIEYSCDSLQSSPTQSRSSLRKEDEIILEFDPLMNNHLNDMPDEINRIDQNDSNDELLFKFVLSYHQKTNKFISTLQNFVGETQKQSNDFKWINVYSSESFLSRLSSSSASVDRKLSEIFQKILSSSVIDDNNTDVRKRSESNQSNKLLQSEKKEIDTYQMVIMDRGERSESYKKLPERSENPSKLDLISCKDLNDSVKVDSSINKNPNEAISQSQANSLQENLLNQSLNIKPKEPLFLIKEEQQEQQQDSPVSFDRFSIDQQEWSPFNDFNREYLIQTATEERRNEYVSYDNYSLFIGTWNVNGQTLTRADLIKKYFLSIDTNGPDLYAIGFQELDLSKEAFLFNDNKREDYWLKICEQSLHPDRNYFLVKKIRLIGMMIVVFAAQEFLPLIKNVAAETVGTGILGKMGNKGGVAVRFDLHDTSICFVNCHLAAHVEQFERRNSDFREINSRLQFQSLKPFPKRICDHDQIYWFGDLNYRIMRLNSDDVKQLLDDGHIDIVLAHDQLLKQMQLNNCFQGFTEGPINYQPSYKYNPGTNQWDSSEKRRPPAWCDRILWKGENITQTSYRVHLELKDSDHKPVSSWFQSKVLQIDHLKKRKVYEDVMKKMDRMENELLPQVTIDTTEITFGTVSFNENVCRHLNLVNIGQSRIRFRFINKPNDSNFCKPWLRVTPSAGKIKIKEKITIMFEMNFDDPSMAHKFNYGLEKLVDTLVLSLIGGKDIFITVSGDYRLSSFGCSLDTLVSLERPISTMTLDEFRKKFPIKSFDTNLREKMMECVLGKHDEQKISLESKKFPIPKELYFLIDQLVQTNNVDISVFQSSGLENEFFIIRDALDMNQPESIRNVSKHSIGEALLLFLETLAEPIVPFRFYHRIMKLSESSVDCREIYNELPLINKNVLNYLIKFLQEICQSSGTDKFLNKLYVAKLFGPIIVREPSDTNNNYNRSQNTSTSSTSNPWTGQFVSYIPEKKDAPSTIPSSSSSSLLSFKSPSFQTNSIDQDLNVNFHNDRMKPSVALNKVNKSSSSTSLSTIVSFSTSHSSSVPNFKEFLNESLTPEQLFVNVLLNINDW